MPLARNKSAVVSILFALHLFLCLTATTPAAAQQPDPSPRQENGESKISFWYGDSQIFGLPGLAQRWVNILGHIKSHDRADSVFFRLNDGPDRPLRIGPDSRRLAAAGDFNIELDALELRAGRNTIRVRTSLRKAEQEIEIDFMPRSWPLPYAIDWSAARIIQNAVQVVDGMWRQTELGLRTAPDRIGYDRGVALGDRDWTGYEILLPITVHAVDTSAYGSPTSVSPGFGLVLHWNGHTDTPVSCGDPHCGWLPAGAFHWYNFPKDAPGGLNISTSPLPDLSVAFPYALTLETTYLIRSRVEPHPLQTLYFLKIWQQGEKEPENWSLQRASDRKDPGHGGVLLVAHHVDLTIGTIEVQPLAPLNSGDSGGRSLRMGLLQEYQGIVPLGLTLAAGLLFLLLIKIRGKSGRRKAVVIVGTAVPAAILCFLLEPFLPLFLRHFPLSAGLATLLYIGFDFLYALFLALVWIIILLYAVRRDKREFTT